MNNKEKYIGINQRIPFEVLDAAIHLYVRNGVIDRQFILQKMGEYTTGLNRANKATKYVQQIITRQANLLNKIRKTIDDESYMSLKIDDRKALALCLVSLTYPITYDLLISLAQGFKVQDQINKKFISGKIKSIYGSNRTVDVAIDALLPMLIELNTIKRDKVSLYSLATKLTISNKFLSEIIIFTGIKLSGTKSTLIDDLNYKPWYSYFNILAISLQKPNALISRKDSAVGKGYLTIS